MRASGALQLAFSGLSARDPNCTLCPLHAGATTRCIWGTGNPHAQIMIVGEAPGAEEDREGAPFVGAAGQVLNRALQAAGLRREDVWVTNVVRCRPEGNREPTVRETKACLGYLVEEIQQVKPKVIMALGATALRVLTGREAISRGREAFLEPVRGLAVGDARVMATYHTAAFLHGRNPALLAAVESDLRVAQVVAQGGKGGAGLPPNRKILLGPQASARAVRGALAYLGAGVTAVDCEWTYAQDRRIAWPWTRGAELYSIALSVRRGGEVRSLGLAMPMELEVHATLAGWLRGRQLVFHNAMADLIWLYGLRLPLTLSGDTMLLAHLLNETAELRLETLAEYWVGVPRWKDKEAQLFAERPKDEEEWTRLLGYNTSDTWATLLLWEKLTEKLSGLGEPERSDIARFYTHLSLASVPMFVRMALRGMPLSLERVEAAVTEHEDRLAGLGAQLGAILKRPGLAAIELAASPLQVKMLLAGTFGIEVDTTSAVVMDDLAADGNEVAGLIQQIKHEQKTLGTYLRPWAQLLREQGDGRLHTVYNVAGAETSRTTAQTELGATVQLVMREPWMRELFVAGAGKALDSLDHGQLEMRVAAVVAPEPGLLERFHRGVDPHAYMGAQMLGMTLEAFTAALGAGDKRARDARQSAKILNFGMLYGMQPEKLALTAKRNYGQNWSEERAASERARWVALHPGFESWWRRCQQHYERVGTVRTMFGSYRHVLPDPNKVGNTLVQSPATELVMRGLIDVDAAFEAHPELGAELVAFVHDSGVVLRPDGVAGDRAVMVMQEIMEHPRLELLGVANLGIPLEVEVKSGQTWH